MDMEQAMRTALEYETKVRDAYRKAAGDCGNPNGRKVFGVLAQEEQLHIDYLQEKLLEWKKDGTVRPGGLRTAIPHKSAIADSMKKVDKPLDEKQCHDEIQLTTKALELEKETSDFYKRVVKELPLEHRALFEPFIEIEDGHLALVQAELDQLTGMGFYLDIQEFNMEGG